ncbi:MAG: radical SAM protein [Candidatus Odinarchaeota archaeon]
MKIPVLSSPLWVGIHVTNDCNLKCKHCVYNSGSNNIPENSLKLKEIKEIIDQLEIMGVITVEFLGGEPFTYPHLQEIIDYAYDKSLKVVINTNGIAIPSNWFSKNRNKVFLMKMSLDGHNEQTHDSFRGITGAFNKSIKSIKKAVDSGYDVCLITTLHDKNRIYINEIIDKAKDLGVRTFTITTFVPLGRGEKIENYKINKYDLKDLLISIEKKKLEFREKGISCNVKEELPQTIAISKELQNTFKDSKFRTCTGGFTQMSISSDGFAHPCTTLFNADSFDNDVRKRNIEDIWKKSELFTKWRDRTKLKGKCSKCSFLNLCGGGCRYIAYTLEGDINASDPYCAYEET